MTRHTLPCIMHCVSFRLRKIGFKALQALMKYQPMKSYVSSITIGLIYCAWHWVVWINKNNSLNEQTIFDVGEAHKISFLYLTLPLVWKYIYFWVFSFFFVNNKCKVKYGIVNIKNFIDFLTFIVFYNMKLICSYVYIYIANNVCLVVFFLHFLFY